MLEHLLDPAAALRMLHGSIRKSGVLASEWAEERSMAEIPVIHHLSNPRLPDAFQVALVAIRAKRCLRLLARI